MAGSAKHKQRNEYKIVSQVSLFIQLIKTKRVCLFGLFEHKKVRSFHSDQSRSLTLHSAALIHIKLKINVVLSL